MKTPSPLLRPDYPRSAGYAACLGIPVLVAVSAPTALALRTAEAAGITLIAVARCDGFETFTHPYRIDGAVRSHASGPPQNLA